MSLALDTKTISPTIIWDRDSNLAIIPLQETVRENPWDIEARFNLGNTYRRLRRLELAILEYNAALSLDPTFAKAYFYKAVCCAALGNNLDELMAYEQFLAHAGSEFAGYRAPIERRIEAIRNSRLCYKSIKTFRSRVRRTAIRRRLPTSV